MNRHDISIVFSHNTDHWRTPSVLYNHFISLGCFDPCPFMCQDNNLFVDFKKNLYFINPPYSNIKEWVDYSIQLSKKSLVFLLIPCRTDTKYFKKLFQCKPYIWFFTGRLKFNDSGSAPFPSCLVFLNDFYNGYNQGSIEECINFFTDEWLRSYSYKNLYKNMPLF